MKRDIEHEFAHVMRGSNFIEIFIFRFVFWEILNSELLYFIQLLFTVHTVNSATYGERAFSFSAPILWNNLPDPIENTTSLSSFKSALKTFFSFGNFIFDLFHVELYLVFRSPNFYIISFIFLVAVIRNIM